MGKSWENRWFPVKISQENQSNEFHAFAARLGNMMATKSAGCPSHWEMENLRLPWNCHDQKVAAQNIVRSALRISLRPMKQAEPPAALATAKQVWNLQVGNRLNCG